MIPDLTLRTGSVLTAEGTGSPVNGVNTFQIGVNRAYFKNDDHIEINVTPLGPSVSNWSYVQGSLDLTVDPPRISMNFTQSGSDQVTVELTQRHSIVR